jgi:transposase-like protein
VKCPKCQSDKVSHIHDRDQYDCDACRYQFSVTSGTIMHDTHLPLWKWFLAVYMIVESKKGISANQLKRTLKVAYKTAWYLCHRIRKALQTPDGLLKGVVEIDGTYVGGVKRGISGTKSDKALVMGAVERNGEVRLKSKGKAQGESVRNVGKFARANIATGIAVYSDGGGAYPVALKGRNRHERVNHASGEYLRANVHTNTIEGVFSLFKRSVVGAFHQVSVKHLPAYLDEFEYRYNNRDNAFIFRDALTELLTSENLEYKELVA